MGVVGVFLLWVCFASYGLNVCVYMRSMHSRPHVDTACTVYHMCAHTKFPTHTLFPNHPHHPSHKGAHHPFHPPTPTHTHTHPPTHTSQLEREQAAARGLLIDLRSITEEEMNTVHARVKEEFDTPEHHAMLAAGEVGTGGPPPGGAPSQGPSQQEGQQGGPSPSGHASLNPSQQEGQAGEEMQGEALGTPQQRRRRVLGEHHPEYLPASRVQVQRAHDGVGGQHPGEMEMEEVGVVEGPCLWLCV